MTISMATLISEERAILLLLLPLIRIVKTAPLKAREVLTWPASSSSPCYKSKLGLGGGKWRYAYFVGDTSNLDCSTCIIYYSTVTLIFSGMLMGT